MLTLTMLLLACAPQPDPLVQPLPEVAAPPSVVGPTWVRHTARLDQPSSGAALPGIGYAIARKVSASGDAGPVGLLRLEADGRLRLVDVPLRLPAMYVPQLAAGDVDRDGATELIVMDFGTLWVVDPATWQVQSSFRKPFANTPLDVVDIDGDGTADLLLHHDGGTTRYQPDGTVVAHIPDGGRRLLYGQLDGDPASEVLGPSGVFDGATLLPEPGLTRPRTADPTTWIDSDGDGRAEQIDAGYPVAVYDAATGQRRFAVPDPAVNSWRTPARVDLDHDGRWELVFGRENLAVQQLLAVDGTTGRPSPLPQLPPGAHLGASPTAWDANGDGFDDLLVWTAWGFAVLDSATRTWAWTDPLVAREHLHPYDIDGDGTDEVLLVSRRSSGRLVALDPHTGAVELDHALGLPVRRGEVYSTHSLLAQADGDPALELVLVEPGVLTVIDLPAFTTTRIPTDPSLYWGTLHGAPDLDGDGLTDTVTVQGDAEEACVRSGLAGPVLWCLPRPERLTLHALDLDADGVDELVSLYDGSATVRDLAGNLITSVLADTVVPYTEAGQQALVTIELQLLGARAVVHTLRGGALQALRAVDLPLTTVQEAVAADGAVWVTEFYVYGDDAAARAWSLHDGRPLTTPVGEPSLSRWTRADGRWVGVTGEGLMAF